jgi:hypothetical protein
MGRASEIAKKLGLVVLITAATIEVHELGHFLVFRLAGVPARLGFQRVDPLVPVPEWLRLTARASGPVVTLVLACVLVTVASRRRHFGWATAAFTNATLRLFPLVMDFFRAVHGKQPFSDEGELIRAVSGAPSTRTLLVGGVLGVFLGLTMLAARTFPFEKHRWLKVAGVYLLSLAVGICAVLIDEALGIRGT